MRKIEHLGRITALGVPLMIGSVLQIFMSTMDMFFISRLGTNFAAASAMGTSIAGVIFVFSMLVSAGAIALVARKKGEKNIEGIKRYASTSVMLAFVIGILLSVVATIFTTTIIKVYDPKVEIALIIKDYLKIIFAFTFVVFVNTTLRSVIQATGDTKKPLYIFGGANLLNILLDYIFIVHFKWGIEGAALATVLSQSVACVLMLRHLIHSFYGQINIFKSYLTIRLEEIRDILKIGVWSCVQTIARPITGLIMMRIVYDAGQEVGSAAFGIGLTLINYFFIILLGLSGAITIMVGQKLGEDKIGEAKYIVREGILLSFINFMIFLVPFAIVPELLFIPFKTTPEVTAIGVGYLRIVYSSLVVVGFTFMYRGAFAGTGHTFPPMLSAIIANVVCKVSFAFAFVHILDMGLSGVWVAIMLSVYIEFIIISIFYKKGNLYKKNISCDLAS